MHGWAGRGRRQSVFKSETAPVLTPCHVARSDSVDIGHARPRKVPCKMYSVLSLAGVLCPSKPIDTKLKPWLTVNFRSRYNAFHRPEFKPPTKERFDYSTGYCTHPGALPCAPRTQASGACAWCEGGAGTGPVLDPATRAHAHMSLRTFWQRATPIHPPGVRVGQKKVLIHRS